MPATMNRLVKHLDNMLADGPLEPEDYHFMICQCLETTEWKIRKDNDRDYWAMQLWTGMKWDGVYYNRTKRERANARNRVLLAHAELPIEVISAWKGRHQS